jgi:hypothetical protein
MSQRGELNESFVACVRAAMDRAFSVRCRAVRLMTDFYLRRLREIHPLSFSGENSPFVAFVLLWLMSFGHSSQSPQENPRRRVPRSDFGLLNDCPQ